MYGENTDMKKHIEVSNFLGLESQPQILRALIRDYILKSRADTATKLFTPFWSRPFATPKKDKSPLLTAKWTEKNGSV